VRNILRNKGAYFKEDFEFIKEFVRMRTDEDFIG